MAFEIRYHPDVKEVDIPLIDSRNKTRIKNAIETLLVSAPQQYGEPLGRTLKGYWKRRVGDYRVVFKLVKSEVRILGIVNRKIVYEKIKKRAG